MRSHRLPWPIGTDLARRVVTNREHEIQWGRAQSGEFVPALAAQVFSRQIHFLQQLQCDRVYRAFGMAARAEAAKAALPPLIDQGFRDDAACRVAGAEEQYVVRSICHRRSPPRDLRCTETDTHPVLRDLADAFEATGLQTGAHDCAPPQQFLVRYSTSSLIAAKSAE